MHCFLRASTARFSICTAICTFAFGVIEANGAKVTVGIPAGSPPFAKLEDVNKPTVITSYSGFIVTVCERVIATMMLEDNTLSVEVSPLKDSEGYTSLLPRDSAAPIIDLVCGPINMTGKRLDEVTFSFPVFLSGTAYIVNSDFFWRKREKVVFGALCNNSAMSGMVGDIVEEQLGIFAGGLNKVRTDFAETCSTNKLEKDYSEKDQNIIYHSVRVSNYLDGLDKFCGNRISYFFGNTDILSAYSREFSENGKCDIDVPDTTLTREIYGIAFSRAFLKGSSGKGLKFYLEFQAKLFELLRNGEIQEIFKKSFPGKSMSRELKAFFNIYRRANR